jgi:hypothetical protein
MRNWKAERDALVSETTAFAEAVRSQRPISIEAVVTPRQLPLGVPEHFQQPAPTVSEHAHEVSDETAEQPRSEPMKWGGSEREEIKKRIATFKANQQRFTPRTGRLCAFHADAGAGEDRRSSSGCTQT